MTAVLDQPAATGPATDGPRLLSRPGPASWAHHVAHFGRLTLPADLVAETRVSGLRGRGGASFPTAVKLDAVRAAAGRRRPPVVLANGTESEPLSAKDRTLLVNSPHLVLDGIEAAAFATGADRAVLCLKAGDGASPRAVARALAERPAGPVPVEVVTVPARYVSGEESALVNWVGKGRALPTSGLIRPAERGVDGRPTLVDNVETLAHLALIARHGGHWWSSVGDPGHPGTLLVTLAGGVRHAGVREVPTGTPLSDVLRAARPYRPSGVLVGGYFGTWLSPGQVDAARLSAPGLAALGASTGCGAVAVLPAGACPLAEVARVARWLAGQSAGQCGPCVNGLPAIAGALEALATGPRGGDAAGAATRWAGMVTGRGACKLPDGAAHFVRSALTVFGAHVDQHRRHGPCGAATGARPVLPVPAWRGAA